MPKGEAGLERPPTVWAALSERHVEHHVSIGYLAGLPGKAEAALAVPHRPAPAADQRYVAHFDETGAWADARLASQGVLGGVTKRSRAVRPGA